MIARLMAVGARIDPEAWGAGSVRLAALYKYDQFEALGSAN